MESNHLMIGYSALPQSTQRDTDQAGSGMDLQQYFSARDANMPATERGQLVKIQTAGLQGNSLHALAEKRTVHQRVSSDFIGSQSM